jgi:hypothetical protein
MSGRQRRSVDTLEYEDANVKIGYHNLTYAAEHKTYNITKYNRIRGQLLRNHEFKVKKAGKNVYIQKKYLNYLVRLTKNATYRRWRFAFEFLAGHNSLDAEDLIKKFIQDVVHDQPRHYKIEPIAPTERLIKPVNQDRDFIFNIAREAAYQSKNGSLEVIFNLDGTPIKVYWDKLNEEIRIESKKVGPEHDKKLQKLMKGKSRLLREERMIFKNFEFLFQFLDKILSEQKKSLEEAFQSQNQVLHNLNRNILGIRDILLNQSFNFRVLMQNLEALTENHTLLMQYVNLISERGRSDNTNLMEMIREMQMESTGNLISINHTLNQPDQRKTQLAEIFQGIPEIHDHQITLKNKIINFFRKGIRWLKRFF